MRDEKDDLEGILEDLKIPYPLCYSYVPRGWISLVRLCFTELLDAKWDRELDQIKIKFGGLRVYLTRYTPKWSDIVLEYEKLSLQTCEDCGDAGQVVKRYSTWRTLCDTCAATWTSDRTDHR